MAGTGLARGTEGRHTHGIGPCVLEVGVQCGNVGAVVDAQKRCRNVRAREVVAGLDPPAVLGRAVRRRAREQVRRDLAHVFRIHCRAVIGPNEDHDVARSHGPREHHQALIFVVNQLVQR